MNIFEILAVSFRIYNYEYSEQLCEHHHHIQEYHLNHFLQSHSLFSKTPITFKYVTFEKYFCLTDAT